MNPKPGEVWLADLGLIFVGCVRNAPCCPSKLKKVLYKHKPINRLARYVTKHFLVLKFLDWILAKKPGFSYYFKD